MSYSREFRPWQLLALVAILLALFFGAYELLESLVLVRYFDQPTIYRLHILRGVVSSLLIGFVVAAYLRGRWRGLEVSRREARLPELVDREARRGHSARWFVQMRWVAVSVVAVLIVVSVPVLKLLPAHTLPPLIFWWAVLLVANFLFDRWLEKGSNFERQLTVQATVDLTVLTGLLNASGGIENPLYLVYVFHVILAGILLPHRKAAGLTAAAMLLYLFLATGEYLHFLPHSTNFLFPHAEAPQHAEMALESPEAGVRERSHAAYDLIFVAGRALPFLVVLFLTGNFTAMIMRRVRRSEDNLETVANQALMERGRLEGVLDASGVGMMQLSTDASVTWWNQRVSEWLDWSERKVGDACPLLDGDQGCEQCIVQATAETGKPLEAERRVRSRTGGARYYRHSTSPVKDRDGKVVQVVEVIEDITLRKALEAETAHAAKLSTLGRMAAGVAHEIGNPLSSLSTRLARLERNQDPAFVEQSVGVLRVQIDRIGRIVHGVSQFARLHPQAWAPQDLNSLVQETIGIVQLDRRAQGVEFVVDLAEPASRVLGVRDQLSQVVLNLLLNAVEAAPIGGEVSVTTSVEGEEVILVVRDSGAGIDESALDHLFEPFFTTKKGGAGLGLSISFSLVNAHGGRLEAESLAEGKGAEFRVVLPIASEDLRATPKSRRATSEVAS